MKIQINPKINAQERFLFWDATLLQKTGLRTLNRELLPSELPTLTLAKCPDRFSENLPNVLWHWDERNVGLIGGDLGKEEFYFLVRGSIEDGELILSTANRKVSKNLRLFIHLELSDEIQVIEST